MLLLISRKNNMYLKQCVTYSNKNVGYTKNSIPSNRILNWIDFDSDGNSTVKPIRPFNKWIDFFKDESLYLIAAPGHTIDHIMALVKTRFGNILLAADGVFCDENFCLFDRPIGKGFEGKIPVDVNPENAMSAIDKICKFAKMPNCFVLYSHVENNRLENKMSQIFGNEQAHFCSVCLPKIRSKL